MSSIVLLSASRLLRRRRERICLRYGADGAAPLQVPYESYNAQQGQCCSADRPVWAQGGEGYAGEDEERNPATKHVKHAEENKPGSILSGWLVPPLLKDRLSLHVRIHDEATELIDRSPPASAHWMLPESEMPSDEYADSNEPSSYRSHAQDHATKRRFGPVPQLSQHETLPPRSTQGPGNRPPQRVHVRIPLVAVSTSPLYQRRNIRLRPSTVKATPSP